MAVTSLNAGSGVSNSIDGICQTSAFALSYAAAAAAAAADDDDDDNNNTDDDIDGGDDHYDNDDDRYHHHYHHHNESVVVAAAADYNGVVDGVGGSVLRCVTILQTHVATVQ